MAGSAKGDTEHLIVATLHLRQKQRPTPTMHIISLIIAREIGCTMFTSGNTVKFRC